MSTKSTSTQQRLHVFHPINTGGTTWLRESGLVFKDKRPYVVRESRNLSEDDDRDKMAA